MTEPALIPGPEGPEPHARGRRPAWAPALPPILFLVLLLAGCAGSIPSGGTPAPSLVQQARLYTLSPEASHAQTMLLDIRSQGLHSWLEFEPGLKRSLDYLRGMPQDRLAMSRNGPVLTWGQLTRSAEELLGLLPVLDRQPWLLAERFTWYELKPGPRMTGYYTPEVRASLFKRPGYEHPVYTRPPDLRTGSAGVYRVAGGRALPYHTRAEVDLDGVLAGRGLEIAWAQDPLDLYDLHLEGCGRLRLPDGSSREVVFQASNGRPFTALSTVLMRKGLLAPSCLSKGEVRAFFDKHPDMLPGLLAENERYIFFEFSDEGARGAHGMPLTPMVSVATDPDLLPLGSMLILDAALSCGNVRGLVLAQDTGAAIQGARLDFYGGVGRQAGAFIQGINTPVEVYLLVSRKALNR